MGTDLYVHNATAGTTSVIDTTSEMVVDTIAAGVGPFNSSLVGDYLYVNNQNSNDVTVIDTTNHTVIDTISV